MSTTTQAPATGPAPLRRRVLAQAGWDLRAVLRNGEQLLVTFVLPLGVLLGVARTGVPDLSPLPQGQAAWAGALAVAVVSSAFTGQAIAFGFDRRAGVLRLLATTPLGRGGLLASRSLGVLAVVALQLLVLTTAAAVLGVPPGPAAVAAALPALVLGTVASLAAGLLLASLVRAEAVLALANLAWVLVLVGGGLVLPVAGVLPDPLATLVAWSPTGALGEALRTAAVDARVAWGPLAALAAWSLVLAWAARRLLRWD
ncbi:ABC transporter permease [Aquipuribacter nitratireducens]|uniref:ABC transporter permease n=1 Tax=Aquipuribacter nitratireducens TaxID=650104 RepID=A0ABW0GIL2_9MICO